MREGRFRALVWVTLGAIAALYVPTLGYPFVFDDHVLVEHNAAIRGLGEAPRILGSAFRAEPSTVAGEGGAAVDPGYRPVRTLSYALDHTVYRMGPGPEGLRPWGFRLTNVALHALAALLVGGIGRLACGRAAGLIAGLLFAVHPLATEAVTYVSGRKDTLAGALYLAALYAFLHARARPAWAGAGRAGAAGWWAIAGAAFVLALGAKEMAVTLPVSALLLDVALGGSAGARRRAPAYAIGFAVAGLYAVLVLLRTRPGAVGGEEVEAIAPWVLPRLLTMARIAALYLRLMVAPWPQSADYSFAALPPSSGLVDPIGGPLAVLVLVALGWGLVRLWRAHARVEAALGLLVPLALLPVIQIVPHPEPIAERYLYLPLAFACLLIGRGVVHVALLGRRPRVALALLAVMALALGARTAVRNRDWRSERALFESAARAYPACARANVALGLALRQEGDPRGALDALDRALEVLPVDAPWTSRRGALRVTAQFERAVARGQVGLIDLALRDLDGLLSLRGADGDRLGDAPAYAYVHLNCGALLLARAAASSGAGGEAEARPDLAAAEGAYARCLAGAAETAHAWAAPAPGSAPAERASAPADRVGGGSDSDGASRGASSAATGERGEAAALEALVGLIGQAGTKAGEIAERLGRAAVAREHRERAAAALAGLEAAAARLGAAGARARARALYHRAALRHQAGDGGAARPLLEAAVAADPDFAPARLSLATALMGAGEDDRGLALLRFLERDHRRDPGLLAVLADLATRRVRFREDPVEPPQAPRVERSDRERAVALYAMAEQAWRQSRPSGALAALEAAFAADPGFAPALEMLGRLLLALRRPAEAVPWLERAARLEPASAPAWHRLGEALSRAAAAPAEAGAARALGPRIGPPTRGALAVDLAVEACWEAARGRPERAADLDARMAALTGEAAVDALAEAVHCERAAPVIRRDALARRLIVLARALEGSERTSAAAVARAEAAALARAEARALRALALRRLTRWRSTVALDALAAAAEALRAGGLSPGDWD